MSVAIRSTGCCADHEHAFFACAHARMRTAVLEHMPWLAIVPRAGQLCCILYTVLLAYGAFFVTRAGHLRLNTCSDLHLCTVAPARCASTSPAPTDGTEDAEGPVAKEEEQEGDETHCAVVLCSVVEAHVPEPQTERHAHHPEDDCKRVHAHAHTHTYTWPHTCARAYMSSRPRSHCVSSCVQETVVYTAYCVCVCVCVLCCGSLT